MRAARSPHPPPSPASPVRRARAGASQEANLRQVAQRILINELKRRRLQEAGGQDAAAFTTASEALPGGEAAPVAGAATAAAAGEPAVVAGSGVATNAGGAAAPGADGGSSRGAEVADHVVAIDDDAASAGSVGIDGSQASDDSEGWFPDVGDGSAVDVQAIAAMPAHLRTKYLGTVCGSLSLSRVLLMDGSREAAA